MIHRSLIDLAWPAILPAVAAAYLILRRIFSRLTIERAEVTLRYRRPKDR